MGWRVDHTLSSSLLQSVEEPMVHLRLEVAAALGAPAQPVVMSLSANKFQVLLAIKKAGPKVLPLKAVKAKMNSFQCRQQLT